jgi:uncharacterized protein
LVSSQLDMDRLDYLQRDSFFTGVSEGKIGSDRIIKMLSVRDDKLVVEEKGIYSIENFLTARRLMYWQVYLHKTNICTEQMLIQAIKRAKYLIQNGENLYASDALMVFLKENIRLEDFLNDAKYLTYFAEIDDYDIWSAIKTWAKYPDKVLSLISQNILQRKLFKLWLSQEKPDSKDIKNLRKQIIKQLALEKDEEKYFLIKGSISNEAYLAKGEKISILTKKEEILDIAQASDLPNIKALRKIVKKYYVCWYKG